LKEWKKKLEWGKEWKRKEKESALQSNETTRWWIPKEQRERSNPFLNLFNRFIQERC
jgi:hypothetical protein